VIDLLTGEAIETKPLQATVGEVAESAATKKKGPPPPRETMIEHFDRMLPCKLTDNEQLELSRERCYNGQRVDSLQESLENFVKETKTEVDRRKNEIAGIESADRATRIQLSQGTVNKLTRCRREWHWTGRVQPTIIELREDTVPNAVVSERAMEPHEVDMGLGSWTGTALEKAIKQTNDANPFDDTMPIPKDDGKDVDFV